MINRIDAVPPLSDPSDAGTLSAAALWMEHALLGSVATMVAVIAIAVFGLMMLTGRVAFRRGATIVIGCFVLFGAPAIAAGLLGLAQQVAPRSSIPAPAAATPSPTALSAPPAQYDPYAGASVPPR